MPRPSPAVCRASRLMEAAGAAVAERARGSAARRAAARSSCADRATTAATASSPRACWSKPATPSTSSCLGRSRGADGRCRPGRRRPGPDRCAGPPSRRAAVLRPRDRRPVRGRAVARPRRRRPRARRGGECRRAPGARGRRAERGRRRYRRRARRRDPRRRDRDLRGVQARASAAARAVACAAGSASPISGPARTALAAGLAAGRRFIGTGPTCGRGLPAARPARATNTPAATPWCCRGPPPRPVRPGSPPAAPCGSAPGWSRSRRRRAALAENAAHLTAIMLRPCESADDLDDLLTDERLNVDPGRSGPRRPASRPASASRWRQPPGAASSSTPTR